MASDPRAVTCPRCGEPALERTFIFACSSVRVIECYCVPKDDPFWLEPSFLRNPGRR
jgi:hypothetical protein